jgi:hypothetical protein
MLELGFLKPLVLCEGLSRRPRNGAEAQEAKPAEYSSGESELETLNLEPLDLEP